MKDTAALSGGYYADRARSPSRSTDGSTLVDTETATVNGNGTYTTPTGYTLPTTGTVTGTYQWDASLQRRPQQQRGQRTTTTPNEQVTVSPASPTIVTTASSAVTLGTHGADAERLGGRWRAATTRPARMAFTLQAGHARRFTRTSDTVTGNGTYTASYTLPTTGTVAGTYTWSASYAGDGNNNTAIDQRRRRADGGQPGQPDDQRRPPARRVTLGTTSVDVEGHGDAFGRLYADRHDHLHALRRQQRWWTRRRPRSTATAPTPRRPATRCRPRAR